MILFPKRETAEVVFLFPFSGCVIQYHALLWYNYKPVNKCTIPQFSTDLDQSWYEVSLGAGAEEDQGQVTNTFGRGAQHQA